MQVDVTGIENVLKYIETTKKTKFTIYRSGAGAYVPVFDCLDSDSNSNALHEFRKWAEVMNNNIPYKILLFDFAEITTDENGETKVKKSKNNRAKFEITFILNPQNSNMNTGSATNINGGFSYDELRERIVNDIAKKQSENEILSAIKQLSNRIDLIEMDSDDDDDDDDDGNDDNDSLGELVNSDAFSKVMGLVNMLKSSGNSAVINGDESNKQTVTDNINKAIKILYKNNKQLDKDLLKLAEISEKNPEMFNMLLGSLRSM